MLRLLAAFFALSCIIAGLWQLEKAMRGLSIVHTYSGATPVTVFRKDGGAAAPVVVIAHGFAGSQQLMQPFAATLAHAGYIAVTFDCLGHGRNPSPLSGSIAEASGATRALLEELERVASFARTLPGGDGRAAVLGHSMASDIVIRYAQAHPEVAATVAVSMFSPVVTPASPRDLDVIVGGLEFGPLQDEARRVVQMVSGAPPEPRVTYGSVADGTARRYSLSGGVEHIGVLYSIQSMKEARDWLNTVFGRSEAGVLDERGPALGLLFFGITLLGWPLSKLLPRVSKIRLGAALPWRKLLPIAVAPAILTPLVLWKAPTAFLPILLGDYITLHFAVYGLLTALGIWIASRGGHDARQGQFPVNHWKFAAAGGLLAGYSILVFGLPLDRYVISFWPITQRLPLILAVFAGTLPFFLADEWLTRGESAPRGSYALTKFFFLLSLAIAVALNFQKLFFLILIIPIILLFFIVYGFFSKWADQQTMHPLVGGTSNAAAFAWAIAVTFPMLLR
jgi:pimeloyl-ACP methyl ester carboxylesterase